MSNRAQSNFCHVIWGGAPAPLSGPTENGAPTQCVATESEDVRVVSGDKGQRVLLVCELAGPVNGIVETDSLGQSQVSSVIMMTLVDEAACRKTTREMGDGEPALSPSLLCSVRGCHSLTLHEEVEATGVPAQQAQGRLCHLRQGRVLLGVSVCLILHVFWLKEACGKGVGRD